MDSTQEALAKKLPAGESELVAEILAQLGGGAEMSLALERVKQLRQRPISHAANLLLLRGITEALDRERVRISSRVDKRSEVREQTP